MYGRAFLFLLTRSTEPGPEERSFPHLEVEMVEKPVLLVATIVAITLAMAYSALVLAVRLALAVFVWFIATPLANAQHVVERLRSI
jgi:hypothetical protein